MTTIEIPKSEQARIRPSALPKLAQCPSFTGSPGTSDAAARGTALDDAFRDAMQGDDARLNALAPDAAKAVRWAMDQVRFYANGHGVATDEESCRVCCPLIPHHPGTEDASAPTAETTFDLKTGQLRSYREQMAAYALGRMDEQFCETWRTILIFCDQRQVVVDHWTYAEAAELVGEVIADAVNPAREPVPCEYCGWCALADTCSARVGAVKEVADTLEPAWELVAPQPETPDEHTEQTQLATERISALVGEIADDPARHAAFLRAWKIAMDALFDPLDKLAREKLNDKPDALPGWKLIGVKGRTSRTVSPLNLGHHIKRLGHGPVLAALGPMAAADFERIWKEHCPDEPLPEGIIEESTGPGHTQLRQDKPKKKRAAKKKANA